MVPLNSRGPTQGPADRLGAAQRVYPRPQHPRRPAHRSLSCTQPRMSRRRSSGRFCSDVMVGRLREALRKGCRAIGLHCHRCRRCCRCLHSAGVATKPCTMLHHPDACRLCETFSCRCLEHRRCRCLKHRQNKPHQSDTPTRGPPLLPPLESPRAQVTCHLNSRAWARLQGRGLPPAAMHCAEAAISLQTNTCMAVAGDQQGVTEQHDVCAANWHSIGGNLQSAASRRTKQTTATVRLCWRSRGSACVPCGGATAAHKLLPPLPQVCQQVQ